MDIDRSLPANSNHQEKWSEALSQWHSQSTWQAVYAFLTVRPDITSAKTISEIFDVSLSHAVEAIDGLMTLGLLTLEEGKYKVLKQKFIHHSSKEEAVQNHKDNAREIINRFSYENGQAGSYHFTSSKEDMNWFNSEFLKLIETLMTRGEERHDGIYAVSMTAINFLKSSKTTKENEQ